MFSLEITYYLNMEIFIGCVACHTCSINSIDRKLLSSLKIGVFSKWSRTFIEFSEFSELKESEESLKHELGSV